MIKTKIIKEKREVKKGLGVERGTGNGSSIPPPEVSPPPLLS